MVVHVGIDEKRAREICQEMHLQLRKDYSQEALSIANSRVTEFENRLMPKMAQVDGALEAFADPSFQLLLVEAQKTAASTERTADYDLLSELLIHRFQKGANRITRAGISLAVEIVDKVSDEALLGLTVTHLVALSMPVTGNIHKGLDTLNYIFGKIFYQDLPLGDDWLEHLDILKAVRLTPFGSLKKIAQHYPVNPDKLSGYVDVGVEKNSENYDKSIEILKNNNLPASMLVEHALNSDFCRLNVPNKNFIDGAFFLMPQIDVGGRFIEVPQSLSEEQKQAVKSVYDLYSQDENIRSNNINSFMREWDRRANLKILKEWWDNIPTNFTITSVGGVLAHSKAQRCDTGLPPLN